MNQRIVFCIILMLFLVQSAFAYQVALVDNNFEGIININKDTKVCKEISISLSQQALLEKGVGILSINGVFEEFQKDSSFVSVSVDGGEDKIFWPEDFVCANNCWARIFLPELKNKETKINICAVLGGLTKSVSITTNSFVGIYDSPSLSIKNNSPKVISLGDRAKMSIVVTNSGTKATEVSVLFVQEDTRAKVPIASFDIVEGDSSATTTVGVNETKVFEYYIKPSIVSTYNIPLAALSFTNYFGERQILLSEHPSLSVIEQKAIQVSLVALSEKKPFIFKAIIKNNTLDTFNGSIILSPQTVFVNPIQEISIGANSEKEIFFNSKEIEKGKYVFVASIKDKNELYLSNAINLEVTNELISVEIIFAIIGVLLGVSIFLWLYFKK